VPLWAVLACLPSVLAYMRLAGFAPPAGMSRSLPTLYAPSGVPSKNFLRASPTTRTVRSSSFKFAFHEFSALS
ncbi:uncharacterized protein EDB91DRAFT_1115467, partial [Suillus paluster]|uniref:uncharacterized protein n=1 Tax=Suillus paluster TaxID=48578 RepID=UPI001B85F547